MSGARCEIIIRSMGLMSKFQALIKLEKCLKKEDLPKIMEMINKTDEEIQGYLARALTGDCPIHSD